VHLHVWVTDGVFCRPATGSQVDAGIEFLPPQPITPGDPDTLTERVRTRLIRWFKRAGLLDAEAASDMLSWQHSGFSIDASGKAPRSELLRMAIAGPGSPKPHIADVTQRKIKGGHLTLRVQRFRYHALPGGKAVLYDIAVDPGETTGTSTRWVTKAFASARFTTTAVAVPRVPH